MNDIAKLFASAPDPAPFGQGELVSWNATTFENTVNWRGTDLHNVPLWMGVNALSLATGDQVILAIMRGSGGFSSVFIAGRVDVPPLTDPVSFQGGTVIVEGVGGISVRDGGDITVATGGEVRSENFDGNTATGNAGTVGYAMGNDRVALRGAFLEAISSTVDGVTESNLDLDTVADFATVTITVPSWAKRASVMSTASFSFQNNSGVADAITGQQFINGDPSLFINRGVVAGDTDSFIITHNHIVDTSAISAFDIDGALITDTQDWGTDPSNVIDINAMIAFSSEPV